MMRDRDKVEMDRGTLKRWLGFVSDTGPGWYLGIGVMQTEIKRLLTPPRCSFRLHVPVGDEVSTWPEWTRCTLPAGHHAYCDNVCCDERKDDRIHNPDHRVDPAHWTMVNPDLESLLAEDEEIERRGRGEAA